MHIFITLFVFLAGFAPCSKALQYYASYRGFFKPKYGKHFEHLSYANPLAPKGGQINLAAWRDSFDSFNPYVLRGNPAEGLELLHATLMTAPLDDPNVVYPYLAESIHICPEHTHVIFALRKDATFHDGSKITSKDVVFSFQLLKQFGLPHFSLGLAGVEKATRVDRYRVKFTFKTPSKTLPFFLAKLPVFSKEYYKSYAFQESSLVPPLGSGPYQIDSFRHGDFIRYRRVRKWWGRALPVNAGLYNFDTVTYHYFKNKDAVVEALARNVIDHHREWKISRWHNDYNFQAVQRGDVLKKSVKKPYPHGLNALFMNARKPHLKDRRIRKALNLLFNFEWLNHTVFMNHYVRNKSLFMDTGFGAQGCPSEREKEILDGYDHTLYPPEARSLAFKPVQNAPSGVLRVHFEEALNLFRSAGWRIKGGVMQHPQFGPFKLDFLFSAPNYERQYREYFSTLKRFGIQVRSKSLDEASFIERVNRFDYDVVLSFIPPFTVPGVEQENMWTTRAAHRPGSFNLSGVQSFVVDDLVKKLLETDSIHKLRLYASVLDRILNWGYYIIPMWAPNVIHVAYWDKFGRMPTHKTILFPHAWWMKFSS